MSFTANRLIIAGHLTRDVDLKQIAPDRSVAHFGIAINNRYRASDGETKESVVFLDCEAWGRTGELAAKYLAKGSGAYIEGRLRQDQWQDADGSKRSKIKVVVDILQFTSRPRQDSTQASAQADASPLPPPPADHPTPARSAASSPRQGQRHAPHPLPADLEEAGPPF